MIKNNDPYNGLRHHFKKAHSNWDRLTGQSYVDLKAYLAEDILPKVDITSMANSLEVRVPFLDHNVVELALSFPGNFKIKGNNRKYILKKTFESLLPPAILRPKSITTIMSETDITTFMLCSINNNVSPCAVSLCMRVTTS